MGNRLEFTRAVLHLGRLIHPLSSCKKNVFFAYLRDRRWRVIRKDMTLRHLATQTVSDTAVFVNHITTRYSNPDVRQRYTPHTMLPLGICLAIGLVVIIVLAILFFPARRVTSDVTPVCRRELPVVRPPRETFRHWSQRIRPHAPGRVPSDPLCVICFDKILPEDQICGLDCLHIFHLKCFERLLEAGISKCPICQASFIKSKEDHVRPSEDSEVGPVEALATATRLV